MDSFAFMRGLVLEPPWDAVTRGSMLAIVTIALTFLLEIASLPAVRGVLKQRDGPSLYLQAVALNVLNHFIFGVPIYVIAVSLLCRDDEAANALRFVIRTTYMVLIHAILYYGVHKAFHSSPHLYVYHRFHHRFNTHVSPVAANAVSAVEYLCAYIIPFTVGALLVSPQEKELQFAVALISFTNLLIHTPRLEEISKTLGPLFVTTHGHIEHHKRMNLNYAAPTINVDWIVELLQSLVSKHAA
jgi:sterol desaturase/sphingolipid hydroxylase (fatty acid hydroxylase superfamily)